VQQLGQTRSSFERDHSLLTPDSFVRAALPGMHKATAIVHAAPATGARFCAYTAEFEAGGSLGAAVGERFVFVLEGEVYASASLKTHTLSANGYAFLPAGMKHQVQSEGAARAVVIEKPFVALKRAKPSQPVFGNERDIAPQPLMGDEALQVRSMVPADIAYDLAVNTMTFQPGASLPMVEIHVMEHGLLMLDGGGIYRLGDKWYPVTAGDFIWMAPYCPQWFGALGKTPTRYLIYKDWNRHPIG
jgi:(S)-ureidoglycine aminohydrolase